MPCFPPLPVHHLPSFEEICAGKIFQTCLSLRASVGLSGNDDIGNYTARQTYISQNLLGIEGLVRNGVGNDQLQWEKMQKLNIGTDISILNERVNLSVDAYLHKVSKMTVLRPAPVVPVWRLAVTNSGGMNIQGVEASHFLFVSLIRLLSSGMSVLQLHPIVHMALNLPTNNIITNFAGASYITRFDHPAQFYGYKTKGVYTSDVLALEEGLSIRRPDGTLAPFRGGDVRFEGSE